MDYTMSKYIFVVGAPGSKWSSVCKNIHNSNSIDSSDECAVRRYWHSASGEKKLMHMGAYFDPGMEFGNFFDKLSEYTKEQCEEEFDRPFTGEGVRIIKSHVFAHHIHFLKENWPDCPIVLVHRENDSCLGWWVRCGHFNITYPLYNKYYKDLATMAQIIDEQNEAILNAINDFARQAWPVFNNHELAEVCSIEQSTSYQNYRANDIKVRVI